MCVPEPEYFNFLPGGFPGEISRFFHFIRELIEQLMFIQTYSFFLSFSMSSTPSRTSPSSKMRESAAITTEDDEDDEAVVYVNIHLNRGIRIGRACLRNNGRRKEQLLLPLC